ncbi:MAG: hypothetical protein FWG14_05010 [Peptococcaceae bacterium]|nr:hypothetical protein [Peptococcaceae bacterium]
MRKYVVLISLGVILIVGAAVLIGINVLRDPDPKALVSEALQKLNAAESFRFSLVQHEITGIQEKVTADIDGEKSGQDASVKGKLAGNDVEMICLGDDFLNRDLVNQKWIRYPGIAHTVIQQLFPVEFNPSTLLELDEAGEVVSHDTEVINEKKCWVYHTTPQISQDSLNREWTHFSAMVYVDKRSRNVARIVLTADHRVMERKLRLCFDFTSIGEQINIPRP